MRHEYAGDVGDYVKFALLRALSTAAPTASLGVIWYLTGHPEAGGNGRFRPHLSRDGWSDLDPELLVLMRAIDQRSRETGGITLEQIERSPILPAGTVFFAEPTPEGDAPSRHRAAARASWSSRALQSVADCDLVFLDPDNGLEVPSVRPASRLAGKYATAAEVAQLLARGAGVVLYQHRDRSPWPAQRARVLSRLTGVWPGEITVHSVRFTAYGGRAFLCLSANPGRAAGFATAMEVLAARVAAWGRAHHLIFDPE